VTFLFEPPSDVTIFPGMTAKVIVTATQDSEAAPGFRVPANAVLADDSGTPFVWVVDSSTKMVHRTSVVIGDLVGSDTEITSGLSDGEWIAVSGVHHLGEGMTVRRLVEPAGPSQ